MFNIKFHNIEKFMHMLSQALQVYVTLGHANSSISFVDNCPVSDITAMIT